MRSYNPWQKDREDSVIAINKNRHFIMEALGGGYIYSLEESNYIILRLLDDISGIDIIWKKDNQIKGIASRVQWEEKSYDTFMGRRLLVNTKLLKMGVPPIKLLKIVSTNYQITEILDRTLINAQYCPYGVTFIKTKIETRCINLIHLYLITYGVTFAKTKVERERSGRTSPQFCHPRIGKLGGGVCQKIPISWENSKWRKVRWK